MFCRIQILFHINAAVSEGTQSLSGSVLISCFQLGCFLDQTDTASTTAGSSLDQQRKTDFLSLCFGFFHVCNRVTARNNRNSSSTHSFSCLVLIAGLCDGFRLWSDKGDVALFAQCCKTGILGKQSVARMDCLRARTDCC